MDLSFCFFCFGSICSSILLLLVLLCLVKGSSHNHVGSSKRKFCYYLPGDKNKNIIMQNMPEILRPLVGLKSWGYCVCWKFSEDKRFLEWMGCCCAGTENSQNCGEEHLFPVSSVASAMETICPQSRTKPCGLLSQLPISMPLDSGIRAQTLLTNQHNWVNHSNSLDSNILEGIDFITAQCTAVNQSIGLNVDVNSIRRMQSNLLPGDENDGDNSRKNHFESPINPTTVSETSSLPHDISLDRIRLCSSPVKNFPQNIVKNEAFFEESQCSFLLDQDKQSNPLKSTAAREHELLRMDAHQKCMVTDTQHVVHMQFVEPLNKKDQKVVGRSDSKSDCSDQNEEEEGNQNKSFEAERNRRTMLNERLHTLLSLVPRISNLDTPSVLGDAIDFVKDLQKQVKELQDQLEEEERLDTGANNHVGDQLQQDIVGENGGELGPKAEHGKTQNGFQVGTSGNGHMSKQMQVADAAAIEKQTSQMEPQVEVALTDGNEYSVKVFCENRSGGFVKLIEAFDTLDMDVVHATVTSHKGLMSSVFKVEKKDGEMVEAEGVRDSLLELMRNPSRG